MNSSEPNKDAVIGVVKDMSWPDLRPYAVSLSRCGFGGDKILFTENIPQDAAGHLRQLGFRLVEFQSALSAEDCTAGNTANWGAFGRERYEVVGNFLASRLRLFRNVIWTDVRDVVFQTDPALWLSENLHRPGIVAAGECWRIGDQPHNAQWAEHASPTDYARLKEKEVVCGGTLAGDSLSMLTLFQCMTSLCEHIKDPLAGDQGILNYLLWASGSMLSGTVYVPRMREGWTATAWATKHYLPNAYTVDEAPVFDTSDHVVYTPDGVTPFSIVHQYDRDADWKNAITAIMEEHA